MKNDDLVNFILGNLNYYETYLEYHPNNEYVKGIVMILNKILKRIYE